VILSTQVCQYPPQFTIPNYSFTHTRPKDMYYVAFSKDSLKCKVLVYGLYALEIAQTVMSAMTAFHAFATGYGNFAACNDIWIVWFNIPLIRGINTSNKPIHRSTDESPFFQKSLSWLKRSTPTASASSPIHWVRFYFTCTLFSSRLCTSYSRSRSRPRSPSPSLRSSSLQVRLHWPSSKNLTYFVVCWALVFFHYFLLLWCRRSQGHKLTQAMAKLFVVLVIETGTITGQGVFAG
jgi:hypothetical protein